VARLPAPGRALVADWAGAAARGTTMSLVFGQWPPGAARMSGALTVQIATKKIGDILLGTPFRHALDQYMAAAGLTPEVHAPDAGTYPTDRYVTERATMMSAVFGDDDAELRFYWASRSDLQAIQQGQTVDLIYPVVEIRLSVEELAHLTHTVATIISGAKP
jgi:hypothetical protein